MEVVNRGLSNSNIVRVGGVGGRLGSNAAVVPRCSQTARGAVVIA